MCHFWFQEESFQILSFNLMFRIFGVPFNREVFFCWVGKILWNNMLDIMKWVFYASIFILSFSVGICFYFAGFLLLLIWHITHWCMNMNPLWIFGVIPSWLWYHGFCHCFDVLYWESSYYLFRIFLHLSHFSYFLAYTYSYHSHYPFEDYTFIVMLCFFNPGIGKLFVLYFFLWEKMWCLFVLDFIDLYFQCFMITY